MNLSKVFGFISVAILTAQANVAGAVCLDENMVSGYHEPLEKELAKSVAVLFGETLTVTNLTEDPSDPEGITARIYRVRVLTLLRGTAAKEIDIRDENTSGRFGFDVGKKYLLFVRHTVSDRLTEDVRIEPHYYVSPCGNSGLISESAEVLKQLGIPRSAY